MILFLPLVSIYLCLRSSDKSVIVVSLTGFVFGVIECLFIALFSYMHKVLENSFVLILLHFLLSKNFLPVLFAFLIYFFMTKDSTVFRVKSFFPFAVAFYAVYVPYFVIASDGVVYSFFDLFLHPLLIFSMLFLAATYLYKIYNFVVQKNIVKIVIFSFILLLVFVIPTIFETMIYMKCFTLFVYAFVVAYILLGVILFFISVRKCNSVLL